MSQLGHFLIARLVTCLPWFSVSFVLRGYLISYFSRSPPDLSVTLDLDYKSLDRALLP